MARADYMDLVVIDSKSIGRRLVCRAPWLTHLKEGTTVRLVGGIEGKVIATYDTRVDDNELINFLKSIVDIPSNVNFPRIMQEVVVKDIQYKEEDDELHE